MNPVLFALQQTFGYVKEVFETKDALTAAQMMQQGSWAIVDACVQGNEVLWIMVRFRDSQITKHQPINLVVDAKIVAQVARSAIRGNREEPAT